MTLLLPAFLFLVACVVSRVRAGTTLRWDLRDGLIIGAAATGLWAWAGAESLSVFHQFARIPILIWWAVPVFGLAVWVFKHRPPAGALRIVRPSNGVDWLMVSLAAAALLTTGLLALLTPPTTYDSLCYHLPRQVFWIHSHTIAQYPSFDPRQVEMPPLAEFIGAQMMLLSGGDRFANMPQWFAYLLSAVAGSAIARDMGAGYRAQVFAALLIVLNPAAATQAENAKNDLVETLWIMALFWGAVRIWMSRSCGIGYALFVGTALGLALQTKGSAFSLAPPVCVMVAAGALRANWKKAIPLGASMIVFALAMNAPHWIRTTAAVGAPLGLPEKRGGFQIANHLFTPAALASNLVRNLTLHTCVPETAINSWQARRVTWLHHRLGIGDTDPRTTHMPNMPFEILSDWNGDGNNAAPVHLLLGIAMVLSFRPGKLTRRAAWPAFLVPFGQMFLFAFLLKWQPWHVRLHIPIVSVSAVVLAVWMPRARLLFIITSFAAFTLTLAAVIYNTSKPLVGYWNILKRSREQIMFRHWPEGIEQTHEVADLLARLKPRTIALGIEFNGLEYLLMHSLLTRISPPPTFMPLVNTLEVPLPPSEVADCGVMRRHHFFSNFPQSGSEERVVWVWGTAPFRIYVPVKNELEARKLLPLPTDFGWDGW